jgi:phosphopantothenoylcysteine decarboxylase/phosphopantothenate--cysteine ligase
MGMAVAEAVRDAGGLATLILGPVAGAPPEGVIVVPVRSAADMAAAVHRLLPENHALVMAAAVADYTPAEPLGSKLKKKEGDLFLRLKRTTDILASLKDSPSRAGKCVVGFSLDVDVNLDEGRRKLEAKNLDFIVVNTVSSFGADRENAVIISPSGAEQAGDIRKEELARILVSRILDHLSRGN